MGSASSARIIGRWRRMLGLRRCKTVWIQSVEKETARDAGRFVQRIAGCSVRAYPGRGTAEDRLATGDFELLAAVHQLDALGLELGVLRRLVAIAVAPDAFLFLQVPQGHHADRRLALVFAAAVRAGCRQAQVLDDLRGHRAVLGHV